MRRMTLSLLLLATTLAMPAAQGTPADDLETRVKALEAENRQLKAEAEALRRRIQELEGGTAPTPAPTPPAGSNDPGPEPWGNPNAAKRSLASKIREDLQARGTVMPGPDSDARAWSIYRQRVEKWIESMGKFKQPVQWTIQVSEAVQVSSHPKEFEVHAHVLRADGSRVEPSFRFRCPATAVPNLVPSKAAGRWTLRADLVPMLLLQPEAASRDRANPFGETPTIAPQVECTLHYLVQSMTQVPAASAK